MRLRPVKSSDLAAFSRHVRRHMAESGRDGDPHFAPVQDLDEIDVTLASERRWSLPTDVPGWGRCWIGALPVAEGPPGPSERVVAHAELRGGSVPSALHRAELSLGVERAHRGAGLGGDLARLALSWARDQGLAYVDLRVFAHNHPAQRLYRRLGFVEVARFHDVFRMPDGAVVDDVAMTLRLPPGAAGPRGSGP